MIRVLMGVLGVLVLLAGGAAVYGTRLYDTPGPLPDARAVVVPRGGLEQIAGALVAEGVVDSAWTLQLAALATRGEGALKAGELEFPAGASLRQVLGVLRTARPVQHRLTVPEGLTAAQVVTLLERTPALKGPVVLPAEGRMLPDTYLFDRGTARAVVVERGTRAMDRALAAAWEARVKGLPLTTPEQALTLASIVERETGKVEERPLVAAVFLNRLARGMKLQSDPTVVYGASGGLGVLDHGITRAELDRDDPYNTYRVAGLPPGPIAMPSAASLRAVTQPAQSDSLFFVADGTGGHVFARTNEEHVRNVAKWRGIERTRAARP